MDPLTLFANLLPKILELNLLKVENADLSLFRLQDSTVNLGCINTENFSIQIYVDGVLPDHAEAPLDAPKDPDAPETQWDPAAIASATQVIETPVFDVNRSFEFNIPLTQPVLRTAVNSVPILLAQPRDTFSASFQAAGIDLTCVKTGNGYQFDSFGSDLIPCPETFEVSGPDKPLASRLNKVPPVQLIDKGRYTFGLFSLGAGASLPLGHDKVKFSKRLYRDVLAACCLRPEDREGRYSLRSHQLIAIQKETHQ